MIARHLEEGGISTVTLSNARDITAHVMNPRTVFTNYPLGNPAGRPFDPEDQRDVLRAAFRLLAEAEEPGIIHDMDKVWSESTAWMRLIFSDEQPFLRPEVEAQRQADLARARKQKKS